MGTRLILNSLNMDTHLSQSDLLVLLVLSQCSWQMGGGGSEKDGERI